MRILKIIGIVAGGIFVLAMLLVAAAFMPAVQTWAVRKAVAGQPGLNLEIGRVAVGLSAAEVSEVRFVQDGLVVTVKRVAARYSVWDFVVHRRVNVDRIQIQDIEVDARQMTAAAGGTVPPTAGPAPTPAAGPPAFLGVLRLARLPVDIRLASLAADGRVDLPADRKVSFTLQGGGIETGRSGQLAWKIDYSDSARESAMRALHVGGSLSLHITADGRIDLIELDNAAVAEGPKLPPEGATLELKAVQSVPDGDEIYTARLALVRNAIAEPVFDSRVVYVADAQRLDGTWNLAVRSEQTGALLAGFGFPEVSADGEGNFSIQPDTTAVVANGKLNARVVGLERLGAHLPAVGPLELHAAFDGSFSGNVALLNHLEIGLGTAAGRKLVDITMEQPVSFDATTKRISITKPEAELARIALEALPVAWAQSAVKSLTIDGGELSAAFSIVAEADGSQVHLRTLQPLTLAGVTLRDGDRKLVDQLNLSLSPAIDYSAAKLVANVPDLSLSLREGDAVKGNFTVEVTDLAKTPVVGFSAEFQERLVGVVRPYLSSLPIDLGPILVDSSVKGRLHGQKLQLTRFVSTVRFETGTTLASIETLQPLSVDFAAVRIAATNPAAAAARLTVGQLPLSLAQAFVPKSKFSGTFNGPTVEIDLPAADRIAVRTVAPICVRDFNAAIGGKSLAKNLDLDIDIVGSKSGDNLSADVRRLEVRDGANVLCRFSGTAEVTLGGKLKASGKGHIDADIAAMMRQPAFAAAAPLARGDLTADFEIVSGDPLRTKANLALRNLVARHGNVGLGDFDCQADGTLKPDGSAGTLRMPLTLVVGGRRSDLTLDGGFSRTASMLSFIGKIVSSQIVVGDFQALAALAPQVPAPQPPAMPRVPPTAGDGGASLPAANPSVAQDVGTVAVAPARDAEPFWKGINGSIDADLKTVKYGPDYAVSGVRCAAKIDETSLAIENLQGRFNDSAFKIVARIAFASAEPNPYALTGTIDIPGFDVGAFLRTMHPKEAPALETTLTIAAKLDGRGATLPDLAQNAYGQFDVTGSKGILRALGNKGRQTAGIASSGLRLFGAVTGSDTSSALGELTSYLNEMQFDRFNLQVRRGADLDLKLTSMEFISTEMRLTGHGTVEYRKGVGIADQPLRVEMQLAGKDHLAFLLGKVDLLGEQQDDNGYSLMSSPFVIGGTLAKPDSSQLWKIVGSAAASAVGPAAAKALQGFFGR